MNQREMANNEIVSEFIASTLKGALWSDVLVICSKNGRMPFDIEHEIISAIGNAHTRRYDDSVTRSCRTEPAKLCAAYSSVLSPESVQQTVWHMRQQNVCNCVVFADAVHTAIRGAQVIVV